jgi:hypothetical protein
MNTQFADIIFLIKQSRAYAIKAVNTELINLYWNVGAYINRQLANASWGEKTVDDLADFIQKNYPELKGFNRRGLYRMKQFYETYVNMVFVSPVVTQIQIDENQKNEIVAPVVRQLSNSDRFVSSVRSQINDTNKIVSSVRTQLEISDIRNSILVKISWTHHRTIFSRCKTDEEREFYIRLCIQENYSVKELERQINSSIFERTMISNSKLPA